MAQSITNMQQVWLSNTNTYNSISMSVSTLGYGADSNSRLLVFKVDGNVKFDVDTGGRINVFSVAANSVAANSISDAKGDLRDIPVNSKDTSYVLTFNDSGKILSTNSNITIPNAIFSAGQAISIYNNSSSTIRIANASGVLMQLAGQSNNQNKILSQYGVATIICVSANTFVLSGAGLS